MDESDGLENRCASHSFNQWLGPMKEAPSNERASLVYATPPIGKAPEVGYLEGMGIGSRSVKVLVFGHRVLLRERGTQPGSLDGDCWDFRV